MSDGATEMMLDERHQRETADAFREILHYVDVVRTTCPQTARSFEALSAIKNIAEQRSCV